MKLAAAAPEVRLDRHRLLAGPDRARTPAESAGQRATWPRSSTARDSEPSRSASPSRSSSRRCTPAARPASRPAPRTRPSRPTIDQAFACLQSRRPVRDQPALRDDDRRPAARVHQRPLRLLPEPVLRADRVRPELPDPGLQRRARSPTRCSRRSRTCAMSNRLRASCPDYPIQQYFGDYQHFVQNKAKEWGDICGADHHVCTLRRLSRRRRERDARRASTRPASRRA